MELLFLLVAIVSLVIFVKLLAWTVKIGFAILILPIKILIGLILALLAIFVFLPFALILGVVTTSLAPLLILIPFLPVLFIALGVWLLVRSSR